MKLTIEITTKENDKDTVERILKSVNKQEFNKASVVIQAETEKENKTAFKLFSDAKFKSNTNATVKAAQKSNKCIDCPACKKGRFKSKPDAYVCIGVKEPFIINNIEQECTQYKRKGIKDA